MNSASPTTAALRRHALRAWTALMLCVMLAGCVKNEFKVTLTLPAGTSVTYRIAYYASNSKGGMEIESAIAVQNGKGDLKGITRYPTLVSIYETSAVYPSAIFYAERGDDISITSESTDPTSWKISGNKVNDLLSAWRLDNARLIKTLASARSTALTDSATAKSLNASIAGFVEAHPDSPAASLILYTYFDSRLNHKEFLRLDGIILAHDPPVQLTTLLSRHDMLSSGAPLPPAKTDLDMTVRTPDSVGRDTLRLASGRTPMLILVRRIDSDDYKALTDSLKSVVRWRKEAKQDSTSMRVADVVMANDSSRWAYQVKRDTLKGVTRAFIPAGLADKDMMRLGVRRAPWIIVAAGQGRIAYSGSDWGKALTAYKALKPKAEVKKEAKEDKEETGKKEGADGKDKKGNAKADSVKKKSTKKKS
ncbi:MAG: DUF4369 domain-containing protein [Bacteroides sp.]|nr:DUF4369 domain-containing protein [Bacteroides sp.]